MMRYARKRTSEAVRVQAHGCSGLACGSHGSIDLQLKQLSKSGRLKDAALFLNGLAGHGIGVSQDTYGSLLQDCINHKAWSEGELMYASIKKSRIMPDVFLGNILIDMYSKCRRMADARLVFETMLERNGFTWTLMISGYMKHGDEKEAFNLFWQLESGEVKPIRPAILVIFKACKSLEQGKLIHMFIGMGGLDSDNFLGSALIEMYAKYGSVDDACQVFDRVPDKDAVTWNSMISGFAQQGSGEEALVLFFQFLQEGLEADEFTFSSALKACGSLGNLKQGKFVHCHVYESKSKQLTLVIENALIDMYAKCGSFEIARIVFGNMYKRDVISWTAMVTGCVNRGLYEEALLFFWQMQRACVSPDEIAFVSILKSCASLAALGLGERIHSLIIACGFKFRMVLHNTLIDMYAKCGSMEYAYHIFKDMPKRDAVSWTSMVSGYALHGRIVEAIDFANQMLHEGLSPDHVTFLGVLSACSYGGLVDEGYHYFDTMHHHYRIPPIAEHYSCIVDMLSRAGRLKEAVKLVDRSKITPSTEIWTTVLSACKSLGEVILAEYAAKSLLKLEPNNTAAFVLLSNVYAEWGRRDEMLEKLVIERGLEHESFPKLMIEKGQEMDEIEVSTSVVESEGRGYDAIALNGLNGVRRTDDPLEETKSALSVKELCFCCV